MGRPKLKRKKVKVCVTIDPEVFDWIQEKIETKEVSCITHAVGRGLYLLQREMSIPTIQDGTPIKKVKR